MAKDDKRIGQLKQTYGAKAVDSAARLHPQDFPEVMEWAEEIDPHYAKLLSDFTYGGLFERGILDDRTRSLVVIGQFVAMDEMEELPIHIRSALTHGATPREALEVILQVGVYAGYPRVKRATRVFKRVLTELGRMDEITKTQLPLDGGKSKRSLEQERRTWKMPDSPRREELLKKYSWQSFSPGLRLQPHHHPNSVDRLDRIDQHFNKLWLDFIYAGMYSRGILDDKTRVLCVVGELFVMGELHQAENHIRAALMLGARAKSSKSSSSRRFTPACRAFCDSPRSSRARSQNRAALPSSPRLSFRCRARAPMAEIKVMLSAAFKEAYLELVPQFERATGHKVSSLWVASVAMMKRLKGGEIVDIVILSAASLEELIEAGIIANRYDIARSGVGVAVRAGAPRPDISSGDALKRAVLAAKSIVYSTGPSGIYLAKLFERMGIADQIKNKVKQVQGEPAGAVVARGDAEIGFQQVSELLPVPGIDLVGPLSPDVQEITVFAAGVHAAAKEPDAARALVQFFKSPDAAPVIRKKGMEPA